MMPTSTSPRRLTGSNTCSHSRARSEPVGGCGGGIVCEFVSNFVIGMTLGAVVGTALGVYLWWRSDGTK